MQCKRSWTISIAVLILLTAATRYVSAQVESRAASQTVGEDANDTVTFRVRIQNISPDDGVPTLFAPGAWVLHSKANPLFKNGDADRGEGLESLAEDGNPAKLVETLRSKGLTRRQLQYACLCRHARPPAKRKHSRVRRLLRV